MRRVARAVTHELVEVLFLKGYGFDFSLYPAQ